MAPTLKPAPLPGGIRAIPYLIALIFIALIALSAVSANLHPLWWRTAVFSLIFFTGGMTVKSLAQKYRDRTRSDTTRTTTAQRSEPDPD